MVVLHSGINIGDPQGGEMDEAGRVLAMTRPATDDNILLQEDVKKRDPAEVSQQKNTIQTSEPEEKNTDRFSAELSFLPFFNLAFQQNAFPVVHELKLKNRTGRPLEKIECLFSVTPAFFPPKTITVELLESGEERPLHNLGIELDYAMLSSLSEAARGKMNLEIRCEEELLFSGEYDVEAFAPDQWLGLNVMPELLASFVTPNLDSVNQLLSVVADELEKATGNSSIEGYQADRNRVYEICCAIYRAILSWGIRYSNPPSSFGTPGQRIRFADTTYQQRLGTCLDTTILFASVMEQCGLHPVILLQSGHAYIGCHLQNRYFSDVPMDDLQAIRKLVDLDEFLVLETTMATQNRTFSVAEAAARTEHLNIDGDFQCAIDIVRARYSGIRPLPLKHGANGIEFSPAGSGSRGIAGICTGNSSENHASRICHLPSRTSQGILRLEQ